MVCGVSANLSAYIVCWCIQVSYFIFPLYYAITAVNKIAFTKFINFLSDLLAASIASYFSLQSLKISKRYNISNGLVNEANCNNQLKLHRVDLFSAAFNIVLLYSMCFSQCIYGIKGVILGENNSETDFHVDMFLNGAYMFASLISLSIIFHWSTSQSNFTEYDSFSKHIDFNCDYGTQFISNNIKNYSYLSENAYKIKKTETFLPNEKYSAFCFSLHLIRNVFFGFSRLLTCYALSKSHAITQQLVNMGFDVFMHIYLVSISYSFVKEIFLLLLQSSNGTVEQEEFEKFLCERKITDIKSVHDYHNWTLKEGLYFVTMHIKLSKARGFEVNMHKIIDFFHSNNTLIAIQPEYENPMDESCELHCKTVFYNKCRSCLSMSCCKDLARESFIAAVGQNDYSSEDDDVLQKSIV